MNTLAGKPLALRLARYLISLPVLLGFEIHEARRHKEFLRAGTFLPPIRAEHRFGTIPKVERVFRAHREMQEYRYFIEIFYN